MLVCRNVDWFGFLDCCWTYYLEGGVMDIENFIAEFKKTFVYDLLSMTLKDEQLFEHMVDGDAVLWFKEQTRQMWLMWEKAKAQAVPNVQQALNDRLLVRSIKEQVESHIAEISVNDLFDKGWFAAMKCIQSNIDMLEAREPAND